MRGGFIKEHEIRRSHAGRSKRSLIFKRTRIYRIYRMTTERKHRRCLISHEICRRPTDQREVMTCEAPPTEGEVISPMRTDWSFHGSVSLAPHSAACFDAPSARRMGTDSSLAESCFYEGAFTARPEGTEVHSPGRRFACPGLWRSLGFQPA